MASTKSASIIFAKEVRKLPLQKLGDPATCCVIAFLARMCRSTLPEPTTPVEGGIVAAA